MADSTPARDRIIKAVVVGDTVRVPGSIQDSDESLSALFSGQGTLEPSYPPETLLKIRENSSALGQNIESYVTNIDGLGYRLAPRIDLNAEDAAEKVRDAIWVARVRAAEINAVADDESADAGEPLSFDELAELMPTDEEVAKRIEQLRTVMRIEAAKLRAFLECVSPVGSFMSLRRKTRDDRETTGNAYWEVLRDRTGKVARFVLVPPKYVRCTAVDTEATVVEERVRVGLGFEKVSQPRFFRRYVQSVDKRFVWFKEYGDPRIVSQRTGKIYGSAEEFAAATRGTSDMPATEIIHFKIYSSGEAYGIPRWIGNLLAVLGSRSADEVNRAYFDNKAVPPLALLVSGGRLSADAVDRIETYIRDNIKGQANFHKILVIEAEESNDPLEPHEAPTIKFERLADAQHGDALFQNYDERNIDKVGSSFRLPRLLRGDVRDFNRSTAEASLRFADEQIFEPERNEFDAWFNRAILAELGISMWDLRSNGPQTRDPERIAEIILELTKAGVVVPNEARQLSSDVIGLDLESLNVGWAKQPLQLTLAGFLPPEPTPDTNQVEAGNSGEESTWAKISELQRNGLADLARHNAIQTTGGVAAARALAELDAVAGIHGADTTLDEELADGHH